MNLYRGTIVRLFLLSMLFAATSVSALTPPTNLRVSISATTEEREYDYNGVRLFRFRVAWDDTSNDETGFYIQRSVDQGGTWSEMEYAAADATSAQVGQIAATKAWFRVLAYKGSGAAREFSTPSNVLEVVGIGPPRLDPVASLGATQVKLTWFAWTALHDGYRIERSNDGGATFTQIADLPRTAAEYIDNFSFEPKLYYYRMCAYITALGCSPYKNIVDAKPAMKPIAPGIGFQIIDHQSLRVFVVDNSDNENDFIIQRSIDGQNWNYEFPPISAADYEKDYLDSNLQANRRYYYRAWARNWNGASAVVSSSVMTPNVPVPGLTELYVNKSATGSNDGSSWANAWPDVNLINWAAVKPGTTINISGGPAAGTSVDYSGLTLLASGTEAAPIKVVTSTEGAHAGRVRLTLINFGANNWITIDGRKDRALNIVKTEDVPSNTNLEVSNPSGVGVYASNAVGIRLFGAEVHRCGVAQKVKSAHGIWINSGDHAVRDVEFAYNHVHDNWQSAFEQAGQADGYGRVAFHHNLIENLADNGFQIGQGVDIYNNIIRTPTTAYGTGHPDGVQSMGSYVRIFNNHISGISNSLIRVQLNAATGGQTLGNIQIFNNVLLASAEYPAPPDGAILIVAYAWPVWSTIPDQTWDNILIANNTIANIHSNAIQLLSRVPVINVKKLELRNNIVLTAGATGEAYALGSQLSYTPAQLIIDRNIFSGTNLKLSYAGKLYAKAEDMSADSGFSNSSSTPEFVAAHAQDYRLVESSVNAIDKGTALLMHALAGPFLQKDKDGAQRGFGAGWDIGAYEFTGGLPPSDRPAAPLRLQLEALS